MNLKVTVYILSNTYLRPLTYHGVKILKTLMIDIFRN